MKADIFGTRAALIGRRECHNRALRKSRRNTGNDASRGVNVEAVRQVRSTVAGRIICRRDLIGELLAYPCDECLAAHRINRVIDDRGAKKSAGRWQRSYCLPLIVRRVININRRNYFTTWTQGFSTHDIDLAVREGSSRPLRGCGILELLVVQLLACRIELLDRVQSAVITFSTDRIDLAVHCGNRRSPSPRIQMWLMRPGISSRVVDIHRVEILVIGSARGTPNRIEEMIHTIYAKTNLGPRLQQGLLV